MPIANSSNVESFKPGNKPSSTPNKALTTLWTDLQHFRVEPDEHAIFFALVGVSDGEAPSVLEADAEAEAEGTIAAAVLSATFAGSLSIVRVMTTD